MIELPEPKIAFSWNDSDHQWSPNFAEWCLLMPEDERVVGYTADQLRTYGDQRAAEAREQMREECVKLIGKPVWLTWDVRAALITLIRKLS